MQRLACGLYRTTRPLPATGSHEAVDAGLLVSFHDHDDERGPRIHLPIVNELNRWSWDADARPVDRAFAATLERLPDEGVYTLGEDVTFDRVTWPRRSLVQLGYDRAGSPILFLAQQRFHRAENTLHFAERGIPLARERLSMLAPVVLYTEPDPNLAGAEADEIGGQHDRT